MTLRPVRAKTDRRRELSGPPPNNANATVSAAQVDEIRRAVSTAYGIDQREMAATAREMRSDLASGQALLTSEMRIQNAASLIPALDLDRSAVPDRPPPPERRIEQLADDVGQLLQTASNLRQQYADIAKLYLDTRLKSEEFFRLDDIHREEVASHLYELPYWEAENTRASAEKALQSASAQLAAVQALELSDLSQPELDRYMNASRELAALPSTQNVDPIRVNSEIATVHRNKLEVASWAYSKRSSEVTVEQLKGALDTAAKKAAYFKKDIVFRSRRSATSRALAYVQLRENTQPGSILNYSERLASVRAQFAEVSKVLLERSARLAASVTAIYSLSVPPLDLARASLDELATWLFRVQRSLGDYRRAERVGIFVVSLGAKIRHLQAALRTGQDVTFQISANEVGGARGLLKSVGFELFGSKYPISLLVTPPNATLVGPTQPMVIGRVGTLVDEAKPQSADLLVNIDPKGSWRIRVTADPHRADIDDLLLYLWVSYQ